MQSILVLLHCESNTGFAIGPLEATFFKMALALCDDQSSRIHFGYPSMSRGPTTTLPADFNQYLIIDTQTTSSQDCQRIRDYIIKNRIDTIFGFDQPAHRPLYKHLRKAGIKHFISYWGAPMSSLNNPLKLALKRIEVALRRHGPDHYIFESQGMAQTAIFGRGISSKKTSVVYLGVDVDKFRPDAAEADYVYEKIGVPRHRKIFFYSGHMEPRKGVAVIMRAANRMAELRPQDDWHICLFGNRPNEEAPHVALLSDAAREKVTFGGYRNDLPSIQRGCYTAVIASNGWDSFPRSGMEMQASGMPLLVSDLIGLREAVAPDESGFRFKTNDDAELATLMQKLLDDQALRDRLSAGARRRIEREFTLEKQMLNLIAATKSVVDGARSH